MIRQLKNEELFQNVRFGVLVFVILFALLRQNVTALQPFLMHSSLNLLVTAATLLIVLWDMLCFRNCLKAKYAWVLLSLFCVTVLTVLVHVRYSFVDNVKAVINMFIQFFAVYTACASLKKERVHKELRVLAAALCGVWFLAAAISVCMYFGDVFYTQTSTLWYSEGKAVPQGFVRMDGNVAVMRLWGVFLDPNFASCISILTMFISMLVLLLKGKTWEKLFHGANILIQFLYIVLSNSRMSQLILCLCVFVFSWYVLWLWLKPIRSVILRELAAIALAAFAVVLCYGTVQMTQTSLPHAKGAFESVCAQFAEKDVQNDDTDTDSTTETPDTPSETQDAPSEIESLERQDIEVKADISNGRFGLWGEGFEVFRTSPVIGVGPRSYGKVAEEVNPSLRIAGYSIHNSFMELLMGDGILGFGIMVMFFLLIVRDALVLRYCGGKKLEKIALLLVSVLACLGCGMFISSLFYYLTAMALLVFAMAGYAVSLMNEKMELTTR